MKSKSVFPVSDLNIILEFFEYTSDTVFITCNLEKESKIFLVNVKLYQNTDGESFYKKEFNIKSKLNPDIYKKRMFFYRSFIGLKREACLYEK